MYFYPHQNGIRVNLNINSRNWGGSYIFNEILDALVKGFNEINNNSISYDFACAVQIEYVI